VNPSFHLGNNVISLSAGLQKTLRRDSEDPFHMNSELVPAVCILLSTSSFFNRVSVKGFASHEAGPFTQSNLRSRDLAGALEFRVGRPWDKTALITGWGARDEQFFPVIREFYYTSTYAGFEHRFTENLNLRAVGEYLRSWRVEEQQFAIAQAFRPAANIDYTFKRNWSVEASVAYSRNMGFHAYDALRADSAFPYAMPFRRVFQENGERFHSDIQYASRLCATGKLFQFFGWEQSAVPALYPHQYFLSIHV
jgi:hypothetical protein